MIRVSIISPDAAWTHTVKEMPRKGDKLKINHSIYVVERVSWDMDAPPDGIEAFIYIV